MGAARLLDGTGSLPAHLAGQAHYRWNEISPSRRLQSADRSLTGHWPENGTNPKFAAAMQNASNIGPAAGGTLPQIAGCGLISEWATICPEPGATPFPAAASEASAV